MTYRFGRPFLLLSVASLISLEANATIITTVATKTSNNTGDIEISETTETIAGGMSVQATQSHVDSAIAVAVVQASQGIVRSEVGGGTLPGRDAFASAWSYAKVDDWITVSRDDLNGQVGHIVLAFVHNVDLDVVAKLGGQAGMDMGLYAGINTGATWTQSWTSAYYQENGLNGSLTKSLFANSGSSLAGLDPEAITITSDTWVERILVESDFVFGDAFYQWMETSVSSFANSQTSAAQLGKGGISTFWFDGIQSVTFGGVEISDYDINSTSGADYSLSFGPKGKPVSVSEPDSIVLLLAGLAGMGLLRRHSY
jgi:hypothetical protein